MQHRKKTEDDVPPLASSSSSTSLFSFPLIVSYLSSFSSTSSSFTFTRLSRFKLWTRINSIYLSCTPPRIRRYILWFFIVVLFIMEVEDQYMIRKYILTRKELLASDAYKHSKSHIQLLSTDFHIGPINDLKTTLAKYPRLKIDILDLSLSEACKHVHTCANKSSLHVLQSGNPKHSLYFSYATRMEFFKVYRKAHFNYYTTYPSHNAVIKQEKTRTWYSDILSFIGRNKKLYGSIPDYFSADTLLARSDAVICSHPVGMCELYMPFNISIILWATTRFEQGREDDEYRFSGLIKNVQAIGKKPYNSVIANNLYDVAYIEYFTGIKPLYIPSICDYTGAKYAWPGAFPKSATDGVAGMPRSLFSIPVFGYRPGVQPTSLFHFLQAPNNILHGRHLPFRLQNIHEMYTRRYEYSELVTDHPAVLYLPYQVSVMSFFEQYKMGIPIFVPSLQLLIRWQMRFLFVGEKGWKFNTKSVIPRHPNASSGYAHYRAGVPYWDPNDDDSYGAIAHWLSYSDYYNYPHVIYFDSWEELADKLESTDFRAVSEAMHEYSKYLEDYVIHQWKTVFKRIRTAGSSRRSEITFERYFPTLQLSTTSTVQNISDLITLLTNKRNEHGDSSLSTASVTSSSPILRHHRPKHTPKTLTTSSSQPPITGSESGSQTDKFSKSLSSSTSPPQSFQSSSVSQPTPRPPWNKHYTNKLLDPDYPDDVEVDYYMRMNAIYGEDNWEKY